MSFLPGQKCLLLKKLRKEEKKGKKREKSVDSPGFL